jgi:hypothetical protein
MMRRTAADRRAEAARAQQMTEQAQQRVQDRKTGEFYNPQEAFDTIMNKPEILAMLKRLAIR